jgi:rifampicin phosphotransferase
MRAIYLLIIACVSAALLFFNSLHAAPLERAVIETEAQFSELARTSAGGRHASFQQMLFVIDRGSPDKIKLHYVNSNQFAYHIDFVLRRYLSTQSLEQINNVSYTEPDRRFIFGSIVHYPGLDKYGVEFWEGDVLTTDILKTVFKTLQPTFPKPLYFKPNSEPQINVGAQIPGLATLDTNQIYGSRSELILNEGRAVGRLRIIPKITDDIIIRRDEIIILSEVPLQLSPVSGIITTEFSTPLSHVNLLAKSWKVPNGYVRDADKKFAKLDGKWVKMAMKNGVITVIAANPRDIAKAKQVVISKSIQIAASDLSYRELPSLTEQRMTDGIRTGAKAANLGEVATKISGKQNDFIIPAGFSIPFAYYADFIQSNGLDKQINALLSDPKFRDNAALRRAKLLELREAFARGTFDPALLTKITQRRRIVIGEGGVFARSSTNSEDLPGFNGAGLYSSVPNVTTEQSLADAVKKVWGSVWNDAAFEAREAAGIDHRSVMAAVLIQHGMNADASGVMITENPFEPNEIGSIFINAKRGLGIRVVEGRKVAEQLLYRENPEAIRILTKSSDDAMLRFNANGGVEEIPIETGRAVLTDFNARRLAYVGKVIERVFGGKPQDIEWLAIGDDIYIVQSRPYLRGN